MRKWKKGEVRLYKQVIDPGCCYCTKKSWRPCRFPKRLIRIGDTARRRKVEDE